MVRGLKAWRVEACKKRLTKERMEELFLLPIGTT